MSDVVDMIHYGVTPCGRDVSFPRSAHVGRHVMVAGGTGRGKTLYLANSIRQFVKPYQKNGEPVRDCNIIVDLAGDPFLEAFVRDTCGALNIPCQVFHLEDDFAVTFDPLRSARRFGNNSARKAMFAAAGMDLLFEAGYGKNYWSRLSVADIIEAFERMKKKGADESLMNLASELGAMRRRRRSSDNSEALIALEQLTAYPQLHESPDRPHIDLSEAIETGSVVYFSLSTLFDGSAARAIGTLAVWSVTAEAAYRTQHGLPPRYTHIHCDEVAQLIGGRSFHDELTLVRKHNVRFAALAYQSDAQLRAAGMAEIIRDNCPIQILMTISTAPDGYLADLQSHSKDTTRTRKSVTARGLQGGATLSEYITPGITRDDAIDVSYGPVGDAFLIFNSSEGHREPIRLRLTPPVDKAEYERILRSCRRASPPKVETAKIEITIRTQGFAEKRAREDLLKALGRALKKEEEWDTGEAAT